MARMLRQKQRRSAASLLCLLNCGAAVATAAVAPTAFVLPQQQIVGNPFCNQLACNIRLSSLPQEIREDEM